ncbi:hypothetical protein N7509_009754 [Penicillium cosmopolitanum]|uniref:Uncharacterized protein n=1 Tax=Penicillium cosmopolitanum TaxID=1131564 RepID=A0A9X0B3W9_9EURO|nr:uncharacterized protein N7509_009754 [Penicillium cosmopolitanum]KAJ5387213.1 hypothetical protein N7509_009754 [Penicillium cosmopolitanum]
MSDTACLGPAFTFPHAPRNAPWAAPADLAQHPNKTVIMHRVENLGPLAKFWEMDEVMKAMISTRAHCTYISGYSDNGGTERQKVSQEIVRVRCRTRKLNPWLMLIAKSRGRSDSAMQPCSPVALQS